VREILARGAPYSESSFYACLLNGYEQGLPLAQIQKDCETKLAIDDGKGFGPASAGDLLGSFGKNSTYFDPASVSGACHSGDGRVSAGPDGRGRTIMNYKDGRVVDWGSNSWGGKGNCDSSGCYKGLSEEESGRQKKANIDDANLKLEAYKDAKKQAEDDPQDAAKAAAAQAAKKAAEEAAEKAAKDPNKVPKPAPTPPVNVSSSNTNSGSSGASRPTGPDASPCEEALQTAREILGECQRTGWKNGSCQELWAKMHGCADPTLILVDPDAGYVCGVKLDPEAIKTAAVEKCRQLKRPVPGGPDPCVPPEVEATGRYARTGSPDDWCHSPLALVDPEAPECLGVVTVQDFGPNIQEILVWGLNKLGGPIVFIPNRHPPPPPHGGPDPRPGPTP
jgi:hypothetical protein